MGQALKNPGLLVTEQGINRGIHLQKRNYHSERRLFSVAINWLFEILRYGDGFNFTRARFLLSRAAIKNCLEPC